MPPIFQLKQETCYVQSNIVHTLYNNMKGCLKYCPLP